MSGTKRGLQRKPEKPRAGSDHVLAAQEGQDRSAWVVPIERIEPDPDQPRRHFDEDKLAELAADIKARGVRNALTVFKRGETYQIIAGERRYRAALKAQLTDLPVRVVEPENVLEEQLIENLQREDLNAVDEAEAIDKLKTMHGLSVRAVAERLHLPKSTVDRKLSTLKLPPSVRERLRKNEISFAEAERLVGLLSPDEAKARIKGRGRPLVPFKFKEKKDGSFELSVRYKPGLTDKQEIVSKLEETLERIKND